MGSRLRRRAGAPDRDRRGGGQSAPASAAVTETALTTPNAQATGIAAGPDGNLWVTLSRSSRVARVTPAGAVTEFTLPAGRGPREIATASGQHVVHGGAR